MSDLSDNNPPYHIVNVGTGQHCGPFSSYLDAALALSINSDGGWCHGRILNRDEFDAHLGAGLDNA
jgi:hypothetical protein